MTPDVLKSLDEIVHRMLAVDPVKHYQNMDSIVNDLETYVKSESGTSRPPKTITLFFVLVTLLSFAEGIIYAQKVDTLNTPFMNEPYITIE